RVMRIGLARAEDRGLRAIWRRGFRQALLAFALGAAAVLPGASQSNRAVATPPYHAGRTPWGEPDLQGIWTSDDMRGVPRERPDEYGTRLSLTDEEFALKIERDDQDDRRARLGPYGFRNDLRTRSFRQTSLVVDPPDGKIPPLTSSAEARITSRDR